MVELEGDQHFVFGDLFATSSLHAIHYILSCHRFDPASLHQTSLACMFGVVKHPRLMHGTLAAAKVRELVNSQ